MNIDLFCMKNSLVLIITLLIFSLSFAQNSKPEKSSVKTDSLPEKKEPEIPYDSKSTTIVRKANATARVQNSRNPVSSTVQNKNNELNSTQKKYNPLLNVDFKTLDAEVAAKLQSNKNLGKELFEGVCLAYIFELPPDADKIIRERLQNVWKKQALFIAMQETEQNKFILHLNAYFDTELAEEIMYDNKLNVIFKEEFYTLMPFENKH